uniref:Uncharacterized protein n=1 Tax=Anopheles arabiensis TaxID=7173 RepID=A0A8W7MTS7_ANOAR
MSLSLLSHVSVCRACPSEGKERNCDTCGRVPRKRDLAANVPRSHRQRVCGKVGGLFCAPSLTGCHQSSSSSSLHRCHCLMVARIMPPVASNRG